MEMTYDFIVVGSGPSGACVASRLASTASSPSVLLLESGIFKDISNAENLADRWTAVSKFPQSVENYSTVPQTSLNNRSINYAHGKVLGGSSAINMCAYTVGPQDDYERWATMVDDASFGWENAVRIRKEKLECYEEAVEEEYRTYSRPDMSVHGTHGAVAVSGPRAWEHPMMMLLDAAKTSELGFNMDVNSGDPLGLGSVPSTARDGKRVTASKAYLQKTPRNLTILTEQHVVKVVLDGKKAVAVLVSSGKECDRASKEVILSAGAVETPKLLMLSGIGDFKELAKHSIETHHHLPGVGKNLQDHLSIALCWKQKRGFFPNPDTVKEAQPQFLDPLMGFFKADEVLHTDESAALDDGVKEHLKRKTVPIWELACHIPPCTPNALSAPEDHYSTVFVFLHNPQSHGSVTLSSGSPESWPLIDPNFFSHPFDRICALAAMKRTLAFISHPLIASNIDSPIDVPASDSEEDVLEYWRKGANSTWHPSCTAKMGRDEDESACVNSDFKVRGLQSLRVVDLSALPFLLNCHPMSVAYLIGEIAAEKITRDHGLDAER